MALFFLESNSSHSVSNGASDCEQYSDSTQGNQNILRQSDSMGIIQLSRRHQNQLQHVFIGI